MSNAINNCILYLTHNNHVPFTFKATLDTLCNPMLNSQWKFFQLLESFYDRMKKHIQNLLFYWNIVEKYEDKSMMFV